MSNQLFNPVISERTPSRTHYAEVFLSPGPAAIGVTGQNRLQDFIGQEWMLLVDEETREVQLWRENGSWFRVDVPGHPLIGGIAPAGSRRFTLCFDQAATPVVAYELDGVIRVTRWDPAQQEYIQNVSFEGVDPVLIFDATFRGQVVDSDVLLFYLAADRESVRCRVQRDTYGDPLLVWSFGEAGILDRAVALPYRYSLLVSHANGSPRPALTSDMYPASVHAEPLSVQAEFVGGALRLVVQEYASSVGVEVSANFVSGVLRSIVQAYEPLVSMSLAGEFVGGAMIEPIVTYQGASEGIGVDAYFVDSEMPLVGTEYRPDMGLQVEAEFIGGSYELA